MTTVILLMSTIIVPVVIGTVLFPKLPEYARYIVLFFYANLISDATSLLLSHLYGNNMIVYYFFVSCSSVLLGLTYSKFLGKQYLKFFFVIPLVASVEAVMLGTDHFNSYSFTVFNLAIVSITLFTFYKMTALEVTADIFLFNGVLLFYAISSSVFFFAARYLQQEDISLMTALFNIHSYINSVTNILFAYSIWTLSRLSSLAQ